MPSLRTSRVQGPYNVWVSMWQTIKVVRSNHETIVSRVQNRQVIQVSLAAYARLSHTTFSVFESVFWVLSHIIHSPYYYDYNFYI
jgi:hypothetical protein